MDKQARHSVAQSALPHGCRQMLVSSLERLAQFCLRYSQQARQQDQLAEQEAFGMRPYAQPGTVVDTGVRHQVSPISSECLALRANGHLAQSAVSDLLHSTHTLQNTQGSAAASAVEGLLAAAIKQLGSTVCFQEACWGVSRARQAWQCHCLSQSAHPAEGTHLLQVFFAACQGLMYTLCYHLSGLLQDTASGEEHQCGQQKEADRLLPRRPSNNLIMCSNQSAEYCPKDSKPPLGAQQVRGLLGDMLPPILQSR